MLGTAFFSGCVRQAALNKLHALPPRDEAGVNGLVIASAGTLPQAMPEEWRERAPFWAEAILPLPGNLCLIPSTQEKSTQRPLAMCVLDEARNPGKVVSAQAVAGLVCTFQGRPMRLIIALPPQGATAALGEDYLDIQMTHPSFFTYLEHWLKTAFPTGTIRDIEWRPRSWCLETIERCRLQ